MEWLDWWLGKNPRKIPEEVEIIRGRHIGSPTNDRLGPESRVYLQV
jgi:hypothetical protein